MLIDLRSEWEQGSEWEVEFPMPFGELIVIAKFSDEIQILRYLAVGLEWRVSKDASVKTEAEALHWLSGYVRKYFLDEFAQITGEIGIEV